MARPSAKEAKWSPFRRYRFIVSMFYSFNVQRCRICRPTHRQFQAEAKAFGATRRLLWPQSKTQCRFRANSACQPGMARRCDDFCRPRLTRFTPKSKLDFGQN